VNSEFYSHTLNGVQILQDDRYINLKAPFDNNPERANIEATCRKDQQYLMKKC